MTHIKFTLSHLAVLLGSLLIFAALFFQYHPFGGIYLPLSAGEIEQHAYEMADDLQLDNAQLLPSVEIRRNLALVRQLQAEKGLPGSNRLLREGVPGYYWQVYWRERENGGDFEDGEVEDGVFIPLSKQRWSLDPHGKLLGFQRLLDDSLKLPRLSQPEAAALARDFVARYSPFPDLNDGTLTVREDSIAETKQQVSPAAGEDKKAEQNLNYQVGKGWEYQDGKKTERENRTDYEFRWTTRDATSGDDIDITVKVAGNLVSSFSTDYKVPKIYNKKSASSVAEITSILLVLLIGIVTIVLAFKRWRAYELSFGFALGMGGLVAVLFGIFMYMELPSGMGWTILLPLLIAPPFVGGALVMVWAVGDSLGREVWPEKFISLDLIRNGYWLHSKIGESLIRGITLGAVSGAVVLLLTRIIDPFLRLQYIHPDQDTFIFLHSGSPFLTFIGWNGFTGIYTLTTLMLLLMGLLRKRFSSPIILLAVPAVLLVMSNKGNILPLWVGMPIEIIATLAVIWAFYRFDILTAFWALFTALTINPAASLFGIGNSGHLASGWVVAAFGGLLLIYAIVTFWGSDRITDYQRIAPAFAKNITERQRLQRELEIARDVQMSFLPAVNPDVHNLDIAARCIPALEVGGDYYDFVELEGNRLGVVIGDVSGKGTQAAFYMTLTKGFWRALANASDSPAEVLTKLNKLFYDNVKRGVFISMVYGIFDLESGILTLARAGHNPVVMHKGQELNMERIHPRGLALGMEKGVRFGQVIQEVKIPFQIGDLFIFYTDGFTEAMDKNKLEYGEERFEAAILNNSQGTAETVMNAVFKDVKLFAGKAEQHDDMTIVVVKIGESGITRPDPASTPAPHAALPPDLP